MKGKEQKVGYKFTLYCNPMVKFLSIGSAMLKDISSVRQQNMANLKVYTSNFCHGSMSIWITRHVPTAEA